MSLGGSSNANGFNPITIRSLFFAIKDETLNQTLLTGFGPLVNELNVSVTLKLPISLVPVLNTLDDDAKLCVETMKYGLIEYLSVTIIQCFVTAKYDLFSAVSKDRNLSAEQFISDFSSQIDTMTDIIVLSLCNYIKENAKLGLSNNINKELATRVILEHVSLDLLLSGLFNPDLLNVPSSRIGGFFTQAIDFAQDKMNAYVSPHLNVYEVPIWYLKNFNDYIKPTIINYIQVNSLKNLGVSLPVTPLNFPPSDDYLVNLYISIDSPVASPAETSVGTYAVDAWNQYIGGLAIINQSLTRV